MPVTVYSLVFLRRLHHFGVNMPTDDDAAALRYLDSEDKKNWTCKFPKCHRRHDEFFMTTLATIRHAFTHFPHLNVPDEYKEYWCKYCEFCSKRTNLVQDHYAQHHAEVEGWAVCTGCEVTWPPQRVDPLFLVCDELRNVADNLDGGPGRPQVHPRKYCAGTMTSKLNRHWNSETLEYEWDKGHEIVKKLLCLNPKSEDVGTSISAARAKKARELQIKGLLDQVSNLEGRRATAQVDGTYPMLKKEIIRLEDELRRLGYVKPDPPAPPSAPAHGLSERRTKFYF
ncbi:hypothetical protein JCM16303_001209 [Sporobolomyces ruberrimus]